ncbi:MAG: hypothetical protein M3O15_01540 [Acidobacteriota bacterium]|nr:hypothetical protein [Acidobacteriota bacterium]
MRGVKLFAGLAIAVLVQLVGMRLAPGVARFLDVFLVVVVLHALEGDSLSALLAGLGAGLLQDALGNGPFCLFGFADTLVAYGTARLAQRLVIQRATGVFVVVSFASVVQQALGVVVAFLLLPPPSLPDPAGIAAQAAIKAAACGALGMLGYGAAGQLRRSVEQRRRSRMGKLRME